MRLPDPPGLPDLPHPPDLPDLPDLPDPPGVVIVSVTDLVAVELVVAAFAGGAFGAAVGALPSFALAGLLVIVGESYRVASQTIAGVPPAVDVTGGIAFGVVLGPHVAFGGGAAAVAYAARRGYVDADFPYHDAKLVTRGLGSRPDVLAVGGVFGVLGYWIATASSTLAVPVDPVALGVVGSAVLHRLAFGYSVFGAPLGDLMDMSPFEDRGTAGEGAEAADGLANGAADGLADETAGAAEGTAGAAEGTARAGEGTAGAADGTTSPDGGPPVEPWLPYQYRWSHVAALGVVVGILGAYVAYRTASPFLAFGISVVVLGLLCAGADGVPVTHHITLPASTVALALADAPLAALTPAVVADSVSLGPALAAGAAFGLFGALAGEFLQRVFYAHAETHLDPPAASIVVTTALLGALAMAGVLPSAVWIPTP